LRARPKERGKKAPLCGALCPECSAGAVIPRSTCACAAATATGWRCIVVIQFMRHTGLARGTRRRERAAVGGIRYKALQWRAQT
jgi:hypothetical protein